MRMKVDPAAWEALGSRRIATNGIELRIVEHVKGPVVVLCHGFPELAFSWPHQVFALADAGYRVIAPGMRGYGGQFSGICEVAGAGHWTQQERPEVVDDALGEFLDSIQESTESTAPPRIRDFSNVRFEAQRRRKR